MASKKTKKSPAKRTTKKAATKRPRKRKKAGRPTKLTAALIERIEEAIAGGARARDACLIAGISTRTYQLWMKAAREGDERYVEFFDRVRVAQAAWRTELLQRIARGKNIAGFEDWKALAALARFDPELQAASVTERALEQAVQDVLERMEEHMSAVGLAEMYAAYAKVRGLPVES